MCEARHGEGMAQGGIALKRDGNGQQCEAILGKGNAPHRIAMHSEAKQSYGVATQCALTHRQSYAV